MYSLDFRKHVLLLGEKENLSIRELAKRVGVASRSIVNWKKCITPLVKRHRKATKLDEEALKKDIEKHPDTYQHERAKRLNVSESCIWHALKRLKMTYKKKPLSSQSRL